MFVIVVSRGTTDRPWVEHEWTSFMATIGSKTGLLRSSLMRSRLPAVPHSPIQVVDAGDRDVERVAARIVKCHRQKTARPRDDGCGHAEICAIHRPKTLSLHRVGAMIPITCGHRRPTGQGERSRHRGGRIMPSP